MTASICSKCGLPIELCVCGTMVKEQAKIKVYTITKAFRKMMTVVEGIEKDSNPKDVSKKLKAKLACGGTYKDGKIELQGEHRSKVKKLLVDQGFSENQIEVE